LSQIALLFIIITINTLYGEYYTKDFLKDNIYFITFINEYVLILVPVLIYAFLKRLNFREVFRFKNPGFLPSIFIILMSLPAYFVALSLNTIVLYFIQFLGDIPIQPIPVPRNARELLVGMFFIAITPAICEEMMHRGLLLSAYEKRGTLKAIVITSLFFGIFHFDITNLLGPIFLGLVIGYYVIRTDSIFAGMLAHFLNNAIAEFFQYFARNNIEPDKITITGQELISIVFYGIAGLIVLGILLFLFNNSTKNKYIYKPPISSVKQDVISIVTHWPIILIIIIYISMATIYFISI
jgi:membrane protease YdiL (CAAX protease family)